MGVRVLVEIRCQYSTSRKTVRTSALLNSGYESDTPEVILPVTLARRFNLFPDLPEEADAVPYETAGGLVRMYRIEGALSIRVIAGDRTTNAISCAAVVSEMEREVIMSDAAMESLGLEVVSPRSGKWRFHNETHLRDGVGRKLW